MQSLICFLMIFALSLATDVSVYTPYDDSYAQRGNKHEPVFESVFPWKFGFTSSDSLYMAINYINKSPSVTTITVTYEPEFSDTYEESIVSRSPDEKVFVLARTLRGPEAIINLNLYTSNGLCASIRVAEGRLVSTVHPKKPEKEYKYNGICLKGITHACVLLVDLEGFICKGPTIVTRKSENLKTTTPSTDLANNSSTAVTNDSSSLRDNMKTSTNSSANNTDVKSSPATIKVIIIGTLSGITLFLLAIIAIWKCCWIQYSPQSTPGLHTNQPSDPFYLNMLFRRECDQEIAEIEQHQYEEITPQVTKGG